MKVLKEHPEYILYAIFAQAVIATVGSLYFSEILLLPPCVLCWYQRVVMYPQVLILGVAIMKEDKNVFWYSFPMALIGALLAFYHSLLQWGILPEAAATCRSGISCTSVQLNIFGFVTIPFMAFLGFIVICGGLLLHRRLTSSEA